MQKNKTAKSLEFRDVVLVQTDYGRRIAIIRPPDAIKYAQYAFIYKYNKNILQVDFYARQCNIVVTDNNIIQTFGKISEEDFPTLYPEYLLLNIE